MIFFSNILKSPKSLAWVITLAFPNDLMANRCKLIWPSIIIYFTPAAFYTLWKEMLLLLVLWNWRIKHEGMTPEKRFKFYTARAESSSRLSLLTAEKSFRAYFRQFFNVPFPKNWTVSVLPDVSSQALWSIEIELSTNQNQEKLIFKGFPVDNIRGCLFFLRFSLCQCSKLDLWMRGLSYLNYSCFVCVCVCEQTIIVSFPFFIMFRIRILFAVVESLS